MSTIELKGVSKRYGDFTAVETTDLRIEHGELVTVAGAARRGQGDAVIDEHYGQLGLCASQGEPQPVAAGE